MLFLEVCSGHIKFLVGVIYRPPGAGNLSHIEDVLADLCPTYDRTIICGDLNANRLTNSPDVRQLTNIFDSFDLEILDTGPTCHVKRGRVDSHTTLDWMVTNKTKTVNHGQIHTPYISIHDLIHMTYSQQVKKYKPKIIKYRDLKNMNEDVLKQTAETLPWNDIMALTDIDDKVDKFNSLLLDLYDRLAPEVTKRVTRPAAPWMTDNVQKLRKTRDAALAEYKRQKTEQTETVYKLARNKLKTAIRNAKMSYIRTTTENVGLTKTWDELKKLGLGKQRDKVSQIDLNLDTLNRYFTDLGGQIDNTVRQRTIRNIKDRAVNHNFQPFVLNPVTDDQTKDAIRHVTTKAAGEDKISIAFIHKILDIITPVLTNIFNQSLLTGQFPTLWKDAHVRALPKTKPATKETHFRPINITSAISKALEKLVLEQMTSYLTEHKLTDPLQSGFKPRHSTTTAMVKITEDIRLAMDDKKLTLLLLVDLSAAFNSVDIDILTTKLKFNCNFSDDTIKWFQSYLSNRRQKLVSGDGQSDWTTVTHSVPPGTVIGPILFNIYIQDIIHQIPPSVSHHCFADDIQIYIHTKPEHLNTAINTMTQTLNTIHSWTQNNALIINPDKTQAIIIGSKALVSRVDLGVTPKVSIAGTSIPYSTKVKDLGIIVDNCLSWEGQVQQTCRKVYGTLHSLQRMRKFLTTRTKAKLVQALIWPHLDFCDVVQLNMSEELVDRLQRCLNSGVRFIYNLKRGCHISPYYKQLGWLKLRERRKLRIAVEVFKILTTQSPPYLYPSFKYLSSQHNIHTRAGNKLSIPPHKTNFMNKSFAVVGARVWNSIPDGVRGSQSLGVFKGKYKDILSKI